MADSRALFGSDSDSDDEPPAAKADVKNDTSREGTPEEGGGTPPAHLSRPATPGASTRADEDADSPDEDVTPAKRPFALLADEEESDNEAEHEQPAKDDDEPKPEEDDRGQDDTGVAEEPAVDAEAEDDEETRIEVDIAKLDPDLNGRFIYWKLPDALKIETRPFDAEAPDDEFEDYDDDPDQAVQDQIRQKVKSTIRWRFATMPDGSRGQPESNTKLVKWSDGSYSVAIGNEYFDASFFPAKGEHHQLFIRQGTGLQGGVVFKERLQLRAAKPDAVARKTRLAVASRFSAGPRSGAKEDAAKIRSVRMLNELDRKDHKDPEKHRAEMMRKEEERLKASVRRETQQRRIRERVFHRGITGNYLEGNEEEDANSISLSAIKNQFKRGDFTRPVYSDEDDSDHESRRKKLENAKDFDDDDDDFGVKKKKTDEGVKKRVAVIEDDDED